ncbi:MAG TPA: PD-(D/E)XK nuclease family protein [Terracidiphilus sp.]|nr:PD-(D/E)XK nuclease family protein [Terracidiphilus sp.]
MPFFSTMALRFRAAYNALMGSLAGAEIDEWLRAGGLVVAASDRAARALQLEFHQRRRAENLSAWASPSILDWASFVRTSWENRSVDGRMLLSAAQEQMVWADIIGREKHLATLLDGPRNRLAAMAVRAHELVCLYAPRYLNPSARSTWEQDAGAWSAWLSEFDSVCRNNQLLSASRIPLELIPLLEADRSLRPRLLIVGFDRIVPAQKSLLDAWGSWTQAASGDAASQTDFVRAADEQEELAICARWCNQHLAIHPDARLLVLSQDIPSRRGEFERAFLRFHPAGKSPNFEFSLGIPLRQVPFARAALLLLQWLDGTLNESEIDWLFSSGFASFVTAESAALQAYMRRLRLRGLQRMQWTLQSFLAESAGSKSLPTAWVQRMFLARKHLTQAAKNIKNPLEWANLVTQLLDLLGLPSQYTLTSAEFQAVRRWEQALDVCGSLGFDGRRMNWQEFLAILMRALDETLFAPESARSPIQIAGPAEAAGLTADWIWFLGVDEDAWPSAGSTHPMLPVIVQRESGMPHASPRQDWDVALSVTKRILASAPAVQFSYPRQRKEVETRPSRLIKDLAGPPHALPPDWEILPHEMPITIPIQDASRIRYTLPEIRGGSAVLTAQSQCPFKAFATARLGARGLDPAEAGLTASQRGRLLHDVMHSIWGGPPHGIRSRAELMALADVTTFVDAHVRRSMESDQLKVPREIMPGQYLELEARRLTHLISEWLAYEKTRCDFTVAQTEVDRTINLAGLSIDLRLDRIDQLNDQSMLVIDYKTGAVAPRSWNLPRPDDVQLPLYAGFALDDGQRLGGLTFATLRAGDLGLAGSVRNAQATINCSLKGTASLVRFKLTDTLLDDWKAYIQHMGEDFLAGNAAVDPRDYPRTCERCGLQAVCRIEENDQVLVNDEEEESENE